MNSAILDTAESSAAAVDRLRIGELAALTSVSVETIRYYEARGLISTSSRRASGYREFSRDVVNQVHFIGRAQSLGFSLAEVKELALLRKRTWSGDAPAQLRAAVVSKLKALDERLRELRSLRKELAVLVAACDASCQAAPEQKRSDGSLTRRSDSAECSLVDALENDGKPPTKSKVKSAVAGPSPGRRAGRPRRPVPESDGPTTSQRRTR